MTTDCPECLGTIEYSEKWERVDRFVSDYSDLRPRKLRPDGGRSEFVAPQNELVECYICGQLIQDMSLVEGMFTPREDADIPKLEPVCRKHENTPSGDEDE